MVRSINIIQVKWEKETEARQWAKEITDYVNTHYPDVRETSFWRRFYPAIVLYGMTDAENLASLESYHEQVSSDEEYQELFRKSADFFVMDTFDVVLLSSL